MEEAVALHKTEVDAARGDNEKMKAQIKLLESTNEDSTIKIKELEAKVKEAEPFFQLKKRNAKKK